MASVFATLNAVNCNEHTEKKQNLTYLSWAWAWAEVKKLYPEATYTIYENKEGWFYHTDGKTCWVKTGVTINGMEHVEYLPVMDYKNNSIPFERVTSFDVNKAIQRSLTKACARHGLGLYIYAGEDLPEDGGRIGGDGVETPANKARSGGVETPANKVDGGRLAAGNMVGEVKAVNESKAVNEDKTVNQAKVNALLVELEEKKTKAEVVAFMKGLNGTPEFAVIRPRALARHQSLKA